MVAASLDYAITPEQALTLDGILRERVARTPDAVAYKDYRPRESRWRSYTWREIDGMVSRVQSALEREGLCPGDRVALMLRNSPEWIIFDQAALGLGLVVVPLHMLDRTENVAYILRHADCKLLLVGSLTQWNMLAATCDGLADLARIVTVEPYTDTPTETRLRAMDTWLPEIGAAVHHRVQDADMLATIIYTSGTTGRPKGVMLSHRNILSNAWAGLQVLGVQPSDLLLSFLPLSHAFERTCGYYLTMCAGAVVAYARSVQQIGEDLRTVRPTVLMSVPRIYELIYTAMRTRLESGPAWRCRLFERAVALGYAHFEHRQGRAPWSWRFLAWPALDGLVARKLRARLGGRLRFAVSGGAALPPYIARIFIGLGITVIQGYGLTETSPITHANRCHDNIPESIGKTMPGVEAHVDARGALLIRGPNVMLGYWKNPEASTAVIDAEGWFNTGDIARIDRDGRAYITGRLKEIIVMSNGEKVPPADIECAILRDPLFAQVMLVGEGRPYLGLLAVLDRERWQALALQQSLAGDDAALSARPAHSALLARVAAQTREFPGYARVHRIAAAFEPWSIDCGLMTPTLKLCRDRVAERYRSEIDRMYA